jgi:hypothetical protein
MSIVNQRLLVNLAKGRLEDGTVNFLPEKYDVQKS